MDTNSSVYLANKAVCVIFSVSSIVGHMIQIKLCWQYIPYVPVEYNLTE